MFRFSRFFFTFSASFIVLCVIYLLLPQPKTFIKYATGQAPEPAELEVIATFTLPAATPPAIEPQNPAPAVEEAPVAPPPAPKPKPQPKKAAAPAPAKKATAKPVTKTTEACPGFFTEKFLCLLNEYRISKGLGKVSYSTTLQNVALSHSNWMAQTGTFSHIGINGSNFTVRCQTAGTTCRAENLAKNAASEQNLLDLWKASPTHNANLLGNYSTMGLGISGSYITLLFN